MNAPRGLRRSPAMGNLCSTDGMEDGMGAGSAGARLESSGGLLGSCLIRSRTVPTSTCLVDQLAALDSSRGIAVYTGGDGVSAAAGPPRLPAFMARRSVGGVQERAAIKDQAAVAAGGTAATGGGLQGLSVLTNMMAPAAPGPASADAPHQAFTARCSNVFKILDDAVTDEPVSCFDRPAIVPEPLDAHSSSGKASQEFQVELVQAHARKAASSPFAVHSLNQMSTGSSCSTPSARADGDGLLALDCDANGSSRDTSSSILTSSSNSSCSLSRDSSSCLKPIAGLQTPIKRPPGFEGPLELQDTPQTKTGASSAFNAAMHGHMAESSVSCSIRAMLPSPLAAIAKLPLMAAAASAYLGASRRAVEQGQSYPAPDFPAGLGVCAFGQPQPAPLVAGLFRMTQDDSHVAAAAVAAAVASMNLGYSQAQQ